MKKTLEAQGDPFRRGLPTLQTSLTLPELPPKTPPLCERKFCFALRGGGVLGGSFCCFGRCGFAAGCGYRARLVGGMREILQALHECG